MSEAKFSSFHQIIAVSDSFIEIAIWRLSYKIHEKTIEFRISAAAARQATLPQTGNLMGDLPNRALSHEGPLHC